MSTEVLTNEQKAFLEECALEFSDRFTDSDVDYREIYDTGIPPPPIMHPWYGRNRMVPNRNRAGGSQYNDNRDNRYENNYRHRDRDFGRRDRDYFRRDGDSSFHRDRSRDSYREREEYSSKSFRDQRYRH